MGWRIGNGRVIDGDLGTAHRALVAAKPEAVRLLAGIDAAWVATRAARAVDLARIGGTVARSPASAAWREMGERRRAIERERSRDPEVDPDFDAYLFADPDGRGRTLAMVVTEHAALRDWFDALSYVRDHRWWEGSERPVGTDGAEWDARGADWRRVLPHGVPSDLCVTFRLAPSHPAWPDRAEVLARVPPVGERLALLARDRHREACVAAAQDAMRAGGEDPGLSMSWVMRACVEADRDEAGRAEVSSALAPFVRDVTAEDLFGEPSPVDAPDGGAPTP